MTHGVLVTGVGGNVGQGLVKALRAGGRRYRIVGVDMEPLAAGFSLVDRSYRVPRSGADGFEDRLAGIVREADVEAVFVASHAEIEYFSRRREALEARLGVPVVVNTADAVAVGVDKLRTARFLEAAGLPFPETAPASDPEAVEALVSRRGFPLIGKPRRGSSGRDVFLLETPAQLAAAGVLVPDLVIQQYLGDAGEEYTAGTMSDLRGRVVGTIVLRRHLLQGTTYRTELADRPELVAAVTRVAEALGSVGPCNFQFRLVEGVPYVFEINPRFSGTAGVRYLYGFNEAELAFELFALGLEVVQPRLAPAVVLRYWNEVVVPAPGFAALAERDGGHEGREVVAAPRAPWSRA